MATAWQMIHRNEMRSVEDTHMSMFKYQWDIFCFKKDRKECCFRDTDHWPDQLTVIGNGLAFSSLLFSSTRALPSSFHQRSKHTLPSFGKCPLITHTQLCISQLHACITSGTLKVPLPAPPAPTCVLFHVPFMWSHKIINASKDSLCCGRDVGPMPLVLTEKHIHLPVAWWKVWEGKRTWWGGYKMQWENYIPGALNIRHQEL